MKILIVGAGGIGGYLGARLIEKGEDVTFLVRPKRKKQLRMDGLVVKSIHGDFHTKVKSLCAGEKIENFDLIMVSVKAYHLNQVIQDIMPYVGEHTAILPLLNGYRHYEKLQQEFGVEKILGGLCAVETTLNQAGEVVQTSNRNELIFGEWDGSLSARAQLIQNHLQGAKFNVHLSNNVQIDIWEKYILIATLSGVTTLMRAPVGPILADESGTEILKLLLEEIISIAKGFGAPVCEGIYEYTLQVLESLEPSRKSSMQRDMEKKLPVEADHLYGVLLNMAKQQGRNMEDFPILRTVYSNTKIYETILVSPKGKN